MKRTVSAIEKLNLLKRASAIFALFAAAVALQGQILTTVHSFGLTDGAGPAAPLVQATNGYLYGTTVGGGYCGTCGTVFKIRPNGTFTALYAFCAQAGCPDGTGLVAGLVQATNGSLYGTTAGGGACNNCGTVFKITPSGALTSLYSFPTAYDPAAPLVQATNGDLYGTTSGSFSTIFKITPSGTLTTVYNFCSVNYPVECSDGQDANAGLIQATDGNLYGTTVLGGADGSGTIFRITPTGTLTTLYSFCSQSGCTDGSSPAAGLVQGTDGNFYGTTELAGAYAAGTVFKVTPSGAMTTLYSFCAQSGCPDGSYPVAGLVQATDGNFYGTMNQGGANGYGTVFKITPSGTLTTLYNFCSQADCADGSSPAAGLVQDTDGKLYGTTTEGGTYAGACVPSRCGTVFSLSVGLGGFVETQTTSGEVGATVKILGTNLMGSTSASFNGAAAPFSVVSASEITTTVPPGATTGTVQVVTPSGTLSSNLAFRVLPAVSSFTPTHGALGTVVTINGQSLTQTTGVAFGGVPAAFAVVSDSEITAAVPTGALTGSIIVTTVGGVATAKGTFKVTPEITGFSPSSGPVGTPVTINGQSFTQTTGVTFGGVTAAFTVNSDTEVTAAVPAGAVTGRIDVTTPGGTAASATAFKVN